MKKINLALLSASLIYLYSASSFAEYKHMTQDQICAYDRFCGNALNGDGTVKTPNKALLKLIEEYKDHIYKTSETFGVDPRAVAGAILAENTMNVGMGDAVQDWFAQQGVTSVFGSSFSFGLGQIHYETAMDAEKFMAKKENRAERTAEEVTAKLNTYEGSFEYAAGIVYQAQEEYKKVGIDISDKPEILTTIYNLGSPANRAKNSKQSGKPPQPNYFGFFVGENLPLIEKSLERTTGTGQEDILKALAGGKQLKINGKVNLHGSSPACTNSGGGGRQGGKFYEYNKKRNESDVAVIDEASGDYEILNRNIDCDANDWVLIRDQNGKSGWVSKVELQAVTYISPFKKPSCREISAICKEKIQKLEPKQIKFSAEADPKIVNVLIAAPKEFPADGALSWKSELRSCLEDASNNFGAGANSNLAVGAQSNTQNPALQPNQRAILPGEVEGLVKSIKNKKKEILDYMGLTDWNDRLSPFNGSLWFERELDYCKEAMSSCVINGEKELTQFLAFKPQEIKGLSKVNEFRNLVYSVGLNFSASGQTYKQPTIGEAFKKVVNKCSKFENAKSKNTKDTYKKLVDDFTAADKNLVYGFSDRELDASIDQACVTPVTLLDAMAKGGTLEELEALCNKAISTEIGNTSLAILQKFGMDYTQDSVENSAANYFAGLSNSLTWMTQNKNQGNRPVCAYDPFKTAERVKALVDNDCVEKVLVPDAFLRNSVDLKKRNKVILANFSTDDRFSFIIKPSCEVLR